MNKPEKLLHYIEQSTNRLSTIFTIIHKNLNIQTPRFRTKLIKKKPTQPKRTKPTKNLFGKGVIDNLQQALNDLEQINAQVKVNMDKEKSIKEQYELRLNLGGLIEDFNPIRKLQSQAEMEKEKKQWDIFEKSIMEKAHIEKMREYVCINPPNYQLIENPQPQAESLLQNYDANVRDDNSFETFTFNVEESYIESITTFADTAQLDEYYYQAEQEQNLIEIQLELAFEQVQIQEPEPDIALSLLGQKRVRYDFDDDTESYHGSEPRFPFF